jgi:hypothetical protein
MMLMGAGEIGRLATEGGYGVAETTKYQGRSKNSKTS